MDKPQRKLTVVLHGDEWLVEQIRDEIEWCRTKNGWALTPWKARPALVDKNHSAPYSAQVLAPGQRVEPTGWDHDHCQICWWKLQEGPESSRSIAYTYNGKNWLCTECYEKLVAVPELPPA